MPNNNNRINFQVGYNVDQASVNAVKKSLQDLQNIKIQDFKGTLLDLRQIQKRAKLVLSALQKAFNVNLNTVNVDKFYSELGLVDRNLNNIYNDFAKAGNQGRAAFNGVASALVTTNTQLRLSSSLLLSMGTTMMNTIKWGVASSVMNTFTNSVREAFQYVKSLDSALTDIRIVTGDSRLLMANFAALANKAAQSLGRSTMDYTKAALTFYQQGLSDADVQARTESVLKAQNITGAGLEMADYLTAVWNGYKVANEEAELYVDKLAAVADSSASNMSLLAIAMSKVASSANLLGVPVDNLNAQIATIVATTRQAPESVGNALKTIYSRINDIATGADDAEISLGNYSSKMALVGINVLDANGRLRDTGDVIDEIGGKWETLSHEQQIYLARTMAGQRQYNNLLALFENWGKYTDLVNVSLNSQGTTMEKNSRYMLSLEAHLEQLGAASLRLKSSMIDSDSFKGLIDFGTKGVLLFANLILSIGGGGNALLGLGSIATQVFSGIISKLISNVIIKAQQNKQIYEDMRAKMALTLNQKTSAAYLDSLNTAYKEYIDNLSLVHKSWTVLSQDERQAQLNRLLRIRTLSKEKKEYTDNIAKILEYRKALTRPGAGRVLETDVKNGLIKVNLALQESQQIVTRFFDNIGSSGQNAGIEQLELNIKKIQAAFHGADINGSNKLLEDLLKIKQEGFSSDEQVWSLQQRILQFYASMSKDVEMIPILDKMKKGLQLTQEELEKVRAKFGQVNKDAQTAFNTQQVVKFVAGIGQVASGINGLVNITKVWKNESLSVGEKLLQTFTGLSMSIGMLYSGFKSMLPMVGTLFSTISVGTGSATVGTIALTAATKGLSVALALAGVSAGALMAALWPLFVVGGVIAGIIAATAAWDKFTMSVKEADLAIDVFNEKQKEMATSNATFAQQTAELEDLKDLYELLAEKAGAINFDNTIDNLTEAERNRYNLIKNTIASYNDEVIAGYNAQGLAILKNNVAIEDQILLIKQRNQLLKNAFVESKLFKQAEQAIVTQGYAAKTELGLYEENKQITEDDFQTRIIRLSNAVQLNDTIDQDIRNLITLILSNISSLGLKGIQQDLSNLKTLENLLNNIEDDNSSKKEIQLLISEWKTTPNFEIQKSKLLLEYKEAIKIPANMILAQLQTLTYNDLYNKLAEFYGLGMINSLITSYIEGAYNGEGFTILNTPGLTTLAAQKVNEELLNALSKIKFSTSDLERISSFNQLDFGELTALQYKEQVISLIQEITKSNEELLNYANTQPDIYLTIIKTLFGFSDFSSARNPRNGQWDIDFSNQVIKNYDDEKLKIQKYFEENPIEYPPIKLVRTNRDKLGIYKTISEYEDLVSKNLDNEAIENFLLNASGDFLKNTDIFLQCLSEIEIKAGDVESALEEAAEKTQYFSKAMAGADAVDLLNLQASGQTLNEEQLATLQTSLSELNSIYPEITGAVQVLNKEWLEGTVIYQRALLNVKNAVFDSFSHVGTYTDEILSRMSSLIVSTEDLQNAIIQNKNILSNLSGLAWYIEQLTRIASGYLSCKDLLDRYLLSLQQGNKILEEAAKFNLLLAARSAENSLAFGILALRISLVAKRFVEYAEAGKLGYEGLEENALLVTDVATRYLRLNDAVADLSDNLDKYKLVLLEANLYGTESVRANLEMSTTFSNLKESVADLLDTSKLFLGDDWIVLNMEDILEAAQGNELAIKALQDAADAEILIKLGVDTSALGMTTDLVALWANNLPEGELGLDDTVFLNKLIWAMQEAGADADIIQAALSGMQLDVDLVPYLAGLNEAVDAAYRASDAIVSNLGFDAKTVTDTKTDLDTVEVAGYEAEPVPMTAPVAIPKIALDVTPFGILPRFAGFEVGTIHYSGVRVSPKTEPINAKKLTSATALMASNARKSSGGNVSHSNKTTPGKKGGGGGGGGGKGKTPKAATQAKVSTAKIDTKTKTSNYNPYLQEEKSYERQSKILDTLQNQLKKLVNKDRLNNLKEQNKVLEKQKDILQKELAISANQAAENSTANYAKRLRDEFKSLAFDPDGQISDLNAIEKENAAIYNAAAEAATAAFEEEKQKYNDYIENTWNKYANADEQLLHKGLKLIWDLRIKNAESAAKDAIKAAEDEYKTREDLIKSYNDALKEDQDRLKLINLLTDLMYDNLIAISKIKVDLAIDTGDFERDWLDFENKFIKKLDKDDFLGSAKASAKELMSYFNSNQVQLTANQIKKIRDEIAIMNAGAVSSIYGTNLAQAKEDLEDYMEQQMKDLLEVQDMVDNIKDNYLDAIDDAKDKMDEQIDQYERVNDLIDHNVKMVELLYGDKAYDSMLKYYNLQKSNNERELESLKKQQDYWQKKMNNLVVGSDAWERFKKNLDDVTDNLNDKLEDMIDNLANQFENRVNGIIARLNNALTGGRGLDFLDEQWDYISNYDDNFLDTFETKTGIEEVERLYQSLIDNLVGSPKSQQKLNKLMNDQLKLLREKDHLTEYDLERAKASLEVEKARLALEEARDRKTKMRLRRDSQGNYTYQYVADEEKLGDLQAALADAQANLYNTDKLHYKQNLNTLYDTYKDYIEKMRDLTAEYNATQDEEERKRIQGRIDLLKESTAKLMSGLTEDNKYLLNYLNGSFFDGMGTDTSTLTMEEQMEIMKENIPYMQSLIQDLSDTIVGEGGILPATANMIKEINAATADYDKNVKQTLATAGTSLQTIEDAVNKEGNALDKNITNAQNLIIANNELIKSCQAQIEAMEKLLDYMDKYLNKVMNVLTLLSNLRSAYNTGQGLNGSNLTADNIGMETWGLDTTSGMEYTGNPKTDAAAIKQQIDALMSQYLKFLSAMSIATFDTGGYTGSWGDAEGRLAFLHQGELVLNQDDTMNILNAVQIVRSMASAINSIASGEINSLMNGASGLLGGINNTEQLDQNVHIEANFPNVTQHTLIEQAFENLVNMASMRASKYRD